MQNRVVSKERNILAGYIVKDPELLAYPKSIGIDDVNKLVYLTYRDDSETVELKTINLKTLVSRENSLDLENSYSSDGSWYFKVNTLVPFRPDGVPILKENTGLLLDKVVDTEFESKDDSFASYRFYNFSDNTINFMPYPKLMQGLKENKIRFVNAKAVFNVRNPYISLKIGYTRSTEGLCVLDENKNKITVPFYLAAQFKTPVPVKKESREEFRKKAILYFTKEFLKQGYISPISEGIRKQYADELCDYSMIQKTPFWSTLSRHKYNEETKDFDYYLSAEPIQVVESFVVFYLGRQIHKSDNKEALAESYFGKLEEKFLNYHPTYKSTDMMIPVKEAYPDFDRELTIRVSSSGEIKVGVYASNLLQERYETYKHYYHSDSAYDNFLEVKNSKDLLFTTALEIDQRGPNYRLDLDAGSGFESDYKTFSYELLNYIWSKYKIQCLKFLYLTSKSTSETREQLHEAALVVHGLMNGEVKVDTPKGKFHSYVIKRKDLSNYRTLVGRDFYFEKSLMSFSIYNLFTKDEYKKLVVNNHLPNSEYRFNTLVQDYFEKWYGVLKENKPQSKEYLKEQGLKLSEEEVTKRLLNKLDVQADKEYSSLQSRFASFDKIEVSPEILKDYMEKINYKGIKKMSVRDFAQLVVSTSDK